MLKLKQLALHPLSERDAEVSLTDMKAIIDMMQMDFWDALFIV